LPPAIARGAERDGQLLEFPGLETDQAGVGHQTQRISRGLSSLAPRRPARRSAGTVADPRDHVEPPTRTLPSVTSRGRPVWVDSGSNIDSGSTHDSGSTLDLPPETPYVPTMDRRRFLLTSLAGALGGPRAAAAQAGRFPRPATPQGECSP
jgi:hypothetical protein